ncbi:DUF6082 family protein [Streptomyces sp. NPDC005731]|uniref:DUF6082 family protein n=1 Tax=Streptomyces sp. NPDC005731 TaxID=3157056 RepID=UPI0033E7B9E0
MGNGRLRRALIWAGFTAALMTAIIASPHLLRLVAPDNLDWAELSSISQTYTSVSVLLAAAALVGAVASLAYQAAQTRIAHEESTRNHHRELLFRALDEPDLRVCWGPYRDAVTPQRWKQFTYCNLIVTFWHTEYVLRRSTDEAVRGLTKRFFEGEVGREYWRTWGTGWREAMQGNGPRSRKFADILDAAFRAAEALGPPLPVTAFFLPDGASPIS